MLLETTIINYLKDQSGGRIKISEQQAQYIISLVRKSDSRITGAFVKLFRYNATIGSYNFLYCVPTTQEQIDSQILIALEKNLPKEFYLYECYNAAGEIEGKIYTVNPELF